VIGSDAIGDPVGVQKGGKVLKRALQRDRRGSIAAQDEAGGEIADGEREAVVTVL
jgi:hypothetical protein